MRSATVVFPVPGLPVKLMCSDGRVQARPCSRRRRSIDEQRRDLADARLDRLQRDEIGIDLREHAPRGRSAAGASAATMVTRGARRCPSPCPAPRSGCPEGASVA